MGERFRRFMWGRYGNDRLNQFLMICSLVCVALSFFGLHPAYVLAVMMMVCVYFRMFSRNIPKRTAENQWYLKKELKVRGLFQKKKREFGQRKEFRIYKCPACSQKLRVPRGKGRIAIRCRRCGNEFIKRS